ncbi:MAG: nucleotidyltransferase family protein [Phycisphaerales bacterium]|nr:nucleotidyltransferase family protein [Phycisphaerales bacterium]
MAVDRVERRLRRVAAALDAAGVPYAVVGGNAVAAWVGRVDPSATRATKDVDVLVRRADLDRVARAIEGLGFTRANLRGLVLFVDPDEPSKRAGVHLVWAGERVRPSYTVPAPDVSEAERDPEGFAVLGLAALVRMKLTSFRDIDRVHVADLVSVGLVTDAVRRSLPPELRERLREVERNAVDPLDEGDA